MKRSWERGSDALDLFHARDGLLQVRLDAHLQGHLAHGAAAARACEPYLHYAIISDLDQLYASAVRLWAGEPAGVGGTTPFTT